MTQNSDSTPPLSVLRIHLHGELADAVLLRLAGVNVSLRGVPA